LHLHDLLLLLLLLEVLLVVGTGLHLQLVLLVHARVVGLGSELGIALGHSIPLLLLLHVLLLLHHSLLLLGGGHCHCVGGTGVVGTVGVVATKLGLGYYYKGFFVVFMFHPPQQIDQQWCLPAGVPLPTA
jgi:hypothetical protein